MGAPIEKYGIEEIITEVICTAKEEGNIEELQKEILSVNATLIGDLAYELPTAEQLIGWLEKDYFGSIEPCISGESIEEWGYTIFDKDMNLILWHNSEERQLHSRPEATLAAIDEALDYLLNNKTK